MATSNLHMPIDEKKFDFNFSAFNTSTAKTDDSSLDTSIEDDSVLIWPQHAAAIEERKNEAAKSETLLLRVWSWIQTKYNKLGSISVYRDSSLPKTRRRSVELHAKSIFSTKSKYTNRKQEQIILVITYIGLLSTRVKVACGDLMLGPSGLGSLRSHVRTDIQISKIGQICGQTDIFLKRTLMRTFSIADTYADRHF